jgi:hypothetical protein
LANTSVAHEITEFLLEMKSDILTPDPATSDLVTDFKKFIELVGLARFKGIYFLLECHSEQMVKSLFEMVNYSKDYPNLYFKLFLPKEINKLDLVKPGAIKVYEIKWDASHLEAVLNYRLHFFSKDGQVPNWCQLCDAINDQDTGIRILKDMINTKS